jgi:hypothetical protein
MAKKILPGDAVKRINDRGVLLVFPINNRPLPLSVWSEFHPKTRMVWDWNDDAAGPVHDMWGLMKQLSDCREVVYSKWYQGRATFFSRELFVAILCLCRRQYDARRRLSSTARILFEVLENNSPLSTRKLKELTNLQGRLRETEYSRAMKDLFSCLWRHAEGMSIRKAQATLDRFMPPSSHFRRYFDKTTSPA